VAAKSRYTETERSSAAIRSRDGLNRLWNRVDICARGKPPGIQGVLNRENMGPVENMDIMESAVFALAGAPQTQPLLRGGQVFVPRVYPSGFPTNLKPVGLPGSLYQWKC
jgi:hypothetical protein